MTLLRVLFGLAAVVLLALIVRAGMLASFSASFAAIGADPWGLVSLGDLYLGFFVTAFMIALIEPRSGVALAWIVALFILGNVVSALWIAVRGLPALVRARHALRG